MKNDPSDPRSIVKIIILTISALFLIGTFIPHADRCNVDASEPIFEPALIQDNVCKITNDYTMFGIHAAIMAIIIILNTIALCSSKPKLELAFHGPVCIISTMQLCRFIFAIFLGNKIGLHESSFLIHSLMLAAFTLFNANAFFINPIVYDRIKRSENHSWQKVLILFILPPLSILLAGSLNYAINNTILTILLAFVLNLILFILEFASIFVIPKKFTKIVASIGLIIFTIETFMSLFAIISMPENATHFSYAAIALVIATDALLIYDLFSQKPSKKTKRKRIATTK